MSIKPLYCIFGNCICQQRYVMTIVAFLGIVNFYNMRLVLHIAITEIALPIPPPSKEIAEQICPERDDAVIPVAGGSYNWTEEQQGIILMSFFGGYVVTCIPGGFLADNFGGRPVLAICCLISTVLTILTPVVITNLNWLWLVAVRFCAGLTQGPVFPSMATLIARWVPERERSTIGGFVYSGMFFGSVTGNLITGLVMAAFHNWPVAFYFWGVVSALWLAALLCCCYSGPSEHPHITPEELDYLNKEVGEVRVYKTPWLKILVDPAIISLFILQFGHDWITYTFVVDLPKFFKDVLKFNVAENGIVTGVSFGLMWVFSMMCGWLSDYLTNHKYISLLGIRKLYAIISAIGPTACAVVSVYMGCDRILVTSILWIGMSFMGTWFPGPKVNTLDISRHFSGLIMSITNSAGVVAGMITPLMVAYIAPHGTLLEWQHVFWISFIMCVVTLVPILIWGKAERSGWDIAVESQ